MEGLPLHDGDFEPCTAADNLSLDCPSMHPLESTFDCSISSLT
jgi:hypothetical protein